MDMILPPVSKAPRLMITCYVRYVIDPEQMDAFEAYARSWIAIVNSMGGIHHGYFLPDNGNNVALALFSFSNPVDFENYRRERKSDPRCKAAFEIAHTTKCILEYEVQLMRPVLSEGS